ncbi:hypothetical protein AC579_6498 [Pseudocercospora musae]|uniref:Uncharacterized protein n=1 Tax=Pseudocercospora musae TaxID=113226 RepID=A0A139I0I1_9PEZI|nr:hypothetical protein AC579_6498 [Pseudocercospora musae]
MTRFPAQVKPSTRMTSPVPQTLAEQPTAAMTKAASPVAEEPTAAMIEAPSLVEDQTTPSMIEARSPMAQQPTTATIEAPKAAAESQPEVMPGVPNPVTESEPGVVTQPANLATAAQPGVNMPSRLCSPSAMQSRPLQQSEGSAMENLVRVPQSKATLPDLIPIDAMAENRCCGLLVPPCYSACAARLSSTPTQYRPMKDKAIDALPPMVLPMNFSSHYVVTYIYPATRDCIIMDPWPKDTYHAQAKATLTKFLSTLPVSQQQWRYSWTQDRPTQPDAHSCGVRILVDAMLRSSGVSTTAQIDGDTARRVFYAAVECISKESLSEFPNILHIPPEAPGFQPKGTNLGSLKRQKQEFDEAFSTYERQLQNCQQRLVLQQNTRERIELATRKLLDVY